MTPGDDIIGIDLGGTKSAIARYDATTWELQQHEKMPTEAQKGFPVVLERMLAQVEKMRTPRTRAIGLGVPGLVRQPEGVIETLPNIPGGEKIAVRDLLAKRTGLPVEVDNDARCFALSEARQGAGKGHRVVVGITMGTGVGGGIIIDGRIFHGAHGFAGEIGHVLLRPGEVPYPTNNPRGDAEQYLSGTAMGRRCEAAKRPEDYLEGQACSYLQPSLFKECAWLVTTIVHLIDPEIVVFGGSAGRALAHHLDGIEKELKHWMLPGAPLPKLACAMLPHPGTLGAALLTVTRDGTGF